MGSSAYLPVRVRRNDQPQPCARGRPQLGGFGRCEGTSEHSSFDLACARLPKPFPSEARPHHLGQMRHFGAG